jgi:hypothetical protein
MRSVPKNVQRLQVCKQCGDSKSTFQHSNPRIKNGVDRHPFQPRLETLEEAYFRVGWTQGAEHTADKIHWGPGWD